MSATSCASIARYHFGNRWIEYVEEPGSHTVGIFLYPDSMADELVAHREFLPWKPQKFPNTNAQKLESLVPFKLRGDPLDGFSQGITIHNSDTLSSLRYSLSIRPAGEFEGCVTTWNDGKFEHVRSTTRTGAIKTICLS